MLCYIPWIEQIRACQPCSSTTLMLDFTAIIFTSRILDLYKQYAYKYSSRRTNQ